MMELTRHGKFSDFNPRDFEGVCRQSLANTHLVLPSTDSFDNQNDYLHHQYHQINNLTNSHLVSPLIRHGLGRGPSRKGITSFKRMKYSLYSKLEEVSELCLPIRSSVKRSNNYPGCCRGFCLTAG